MEWVAWVLAVAVLGLGAIAASGKMGELPATITDSPRPHVPPGRLTGDDLRDCRLDVVIRGYSMTQVDELLDRLSEQLGTTPVDYPPTPEPYFIPPERPEEQTIRLTGRQARKAVEAEVAALTSRPTEQSFPVPAVRPTPATPTARTPPQAQPLDDDLSEWRAAAQPARRRGM